jgi:branched-chain amino acid transport system ATP-binding protein
MSVEENLCTAAQAADGVGWWPSILRSKTYRANEDKARERARELLDLVGLSVYAPAPSAILSYGQRKLLAIAAAMVARPKLVILDEPAAGVNPTMVTKIAAAIHKIRAEGVTLIVVEHNVTAGSSKSSKPRWYWRVRRHYCCSMSLHWGSRQAIRTRYSIRCAISEKAA